MAAPTPWPSTSARAASGSATRLLDGVREGQPLGALLGYQLERALHEGHPGIELDECIAPLRAVAPLVAGKLTPTADGESVEAVGARNVVDGLALSRLPRSTVQAALAADTACVRRREQVAGRLGRARRPR